MLMQCEEVTEVIERSIPLHLACEWDNVGLLVGDRNREVSRILLALDATDDVIDQAVEKGADMLITHHPMIFKGIKRVTADDFIGRRILRLAQAGIAYYAMHTNYDSCFMGDMASKRLGLSEAKALEPVSEIAGKTYGIGKVGYLPGAMTLLECACLVKSVFHISDVRIFGDGGHMVKKAAVVPGSGSSEIHRAILAGADLLIAGDIDHHDGIDAVAQGLCVIDAGHYGLEHIFAEDMAGFLADKFDGALFVECAREKEPFWGL